MTIPNFVYGSSTSLLETPISAQGAAAVAYSSSTQQLTISQNLAPIANQIIYVQLYTLATDFTPTILVPLQGAASAYGYNSAALFWTITYTPQYATSTITLSVAVCATYSCSTTTVNGVAVFCYASTTAGAAPIFGTPAIGSTALMPSVGQEISTYSSLAIINNTSLSPINIYLCGYAIGAVASQRIYSSTSTSTTFAGYIATTAKIEEVFV